jgi:cytochrome c oxidase subunit 3
MPWLFLATELLFFGPPFLLYTLYRSVHPIGFAVASGHAELFIGTLNTVLLLTSSAVFSVGLEGARRGDSRWLFRASVATAILGVSFILLKGYEWTLDFQENLFPGPNFSITRTDAGGAQIFWSFYFVATGLHGLHMIVGIGLVA